MKNSARPCTWSQTNLDGSIAYVGWGASLSSVIAPPALEGVRQLTLSFASALHAPRDHSDPCTTWSFRSMHHESGTYTYMKTQCIRTTHHVVTSSCRRHVLGDMLRNQLPYNKNIISYCAHALYACARVFINNLYCEPMQSAVMQTCADSQGKGSVSRWPALYITKTQAAANY